MDSSTAQNPQLAATLQALGGGLSAAAPVAGGNIDSWVATLNGAGSPALSAIASELENLKAAIGTGDGKQIGQSLKTLGEHTTKAAAGATPDSQEQLQQLGAALSASGESLHA